VSRAAERKRRSHEEILASAARIVRSRGIAGARVADVMGGAGLTVGGFYAHFASKEALVGDVIRRAAKTARERLFASIDEKPEEARAEVILARYLSAAHRDATDGCPLPAIAGEIATSAPEHADVLAEVIDGFARDLAKTIPGDGASKRHTALGLLALMVGGLTLARAVRGRPLADDVLRACRTFGRAVLSRP
jgi:TetR/AcrR family transcriptional repressor of nem operon